MKAISIRQPWAWLIVNGVKDVENRTWPTKYRGRVLIHAAKGMTRDEYNGCRLFVAEFDEYLAHKIPAFESLPRGGIVGEAVIIDCVTVHDSEWFEGPYGFILDNLGDGSKPFPFHACRGALGIFNLRRCRVCGCTDDNCSDCVAKTGQPCSWVDCDLCSACAEVARAAR